MKTRTIEVYTAGCPICEEVVVQVRGMACPSCEVQVRDLREPATAERATALGVRRAPAVAVDGRLASCCAVGGISEDVLRAAGVGRPTA